jgi:membrane protease YdiL (CAAX protease family)
MPWGALAPVLGLLFVIAGIAAGSAMLAPTGVLDANWEPVGPAGLIAFTALPFVLVCLILLAWVRFVERRPLASIGLTGPDKPRSFLRGHRIGVLSVAGIIAIIWLLDGFTASTTADAWNSPSALLSIALLMVSFALQSSTEELLFRGWLLSVVSRKFTVLTGILPSSALFTLLHYSRGQQALVTAALFMFGVFACVWALRTRSVLGVMGWHSGWNWLLATGFDLPLTGINVGIPSLIVDLKPVGADWLTGGVQARKAASSACCISQAQ